MNRKAFTLIELLIVVAIIAILAAIAVPNFLEAQTRSKLARVRGDQRSLATGIEAYAVDWQKYPISYQGHVVQYTDHLEKCLNVITTPVAYMTSVSIHDPFGIKDVMTATTSRPLYMYYNYEMLLRDQGGLGNGGSDPVYGPCYEWSYSLLQNFPLDFSTAEQIYSHRAFIVWSPGPDKNDNELYWVDFMITLAPAAYAAHNRIYDATNGTTSDGDVARMGGSHRFKGKLQ